MRRRSARARLCAGADTGIPVAQVEALKTALAEAHKTAEFKIYPGAARTSDVEEAAARLPTPSPTSP
jgi:dienelactone hydrolase